MSNEEILKTLKKKLEEHEGRIQELEKILIGEGKEERYPIGKPKEEIKRLAEKIGVFEDDIEKIFDLEEGSLTLVKITGKEDREKTINATLLVLLGYKYFFRNNEVLSQEIRRNVAENRIPLNNFATHLKDITPSLIRRKGKLKSPNTTYKLTTLGEAEAKELLKKTCEE